MKPRASIRPSQSGYNESALARRLGVSASHLHRVLSGERSASARIVQGLKRLGVKLV